MHNQHGFAVVEFLVVALPLLFSAMASYEVSRWYMAKEAVNLAILAAGRAGSVAHARPQEIEAAFLDALAPLYAPAGSFRSPQERMHHELQQFEQNSSQRAWEISITQPTAAQFADFMQKDLPVALQTGKPAINNNYQRRQHQQYTRGRLSGSTIYDANTLQLQARYMYVPVVPGIQALLRSIFGAIAPPASPLASLGVLPISAAITIEMQSHPVLWLSEETYHVRYQQGNAYLASSAPTPTRGSPRSQAERATPSTMPTTSTTTPNREPAEYPSSASREDAMRTSEASATAKEQPRGSAASTVDHNNPESTLPADTACTP